jgi:hypothetical protein
MLSLSLKLSYVVLSLNYVNVGIILSLGIYKDTIMVVL